MNSEKGFFQWFPKSDVISRGHHYKWAVPHFLSPWCICSRLPSPTCGSSISLYTFWPIMVWISQWLKLSSDFFFLVNASAVIHLLSCFRGAIQLLKLMFRMFTQFHNFMEVHFSQILVVIIPFIVSVYHKIMISTWDLCILLVPPVALLFYLLALYLRFQLHSYFQNWIFFDIIKRML